VTASIATNRGYVIGVDFDNTIVTYDDLLFACAVQRGLIPPAAQKSKKNVRDQVRLLPGGEIEWQKLQALVYGPRIGDARLSEGVRTFFGLCKVNGAKVYIVSHKTELASYDETRTNLRTAALGWMVTNKFFQTEGLGLSREDVFFCATRQEKIQLIEQLGCTHFIDDLEETFLEETFPPNVEKTLYAPHRQGVVLPGVRVVSTWREISEYLFGANR